MIETILDRTLVETDTNAGQITTTELVEKVLDQIGFPKPFEEFISTLVHKTARPREEVEDAFWNLIDRGWISVSADFQIKKR